MKAGQLGDSQIGLVTAQLNGLYPAWPDQPSIKGMSTSQMNRPTDTNSSVRRGAAR
jgi:hypothetical protein